MLRSSAVDRSQATRMHRPSVSYDMWLIGVILLLTCLGLIMVTSSSITIADRIYGDPLYYFWRQSLASVIGLSLGVMIIRLPLSVWQTLSVPAMIAGIFMLVLVLIPGVGREINGSMRWIEIGKFSFQGSEPIKICVVAYLAGYMVRHGEKLRESFAGFISPVGVVILVAALLLLEPDYGTTVVLFLTALGMLFMGGVPLGRFFAWMLAAVAMLGSLAIISPYRMQRLTSFMDPWQDPFNSGFQLTQALIAFGRGEWLGVGLGSSVQKLFYLPESHTDFVFSVFAEEFGLVGSILVILLYLLIVWRSFIIAQYAMQMEKLFAAYMAYGIGLIIGVQAFINLGVNMGLLPTKGLTLPLMSYGGNSMVISFILLAALVRIEYENHQVRNQGAPAAMVDYVG